MKRIYTLGLAAMLTSLISYNVYAIENVTSAQRFNQIIQENERVVVDFYAPWCGPCKTLGPRLENIAKELTDVIFIKVNTDSLQGLANKYGIKALPTVMMFKNGKQVSKSIGLKSEGELKASIKNALK